MAGLSCTKGLQHGSISRAGRSPTDPDADDLVQLLEQHWQALTQDSVVSTTSSFARIALL
jgi:hypothetical protein